AAGHGRPVGGRGRRSPARRAAAIAGGAGRRVRRGPRAPAGPARRPRRGTTGRLDVELVRRGLARARGQAEEMVRAGRVSVDGRRADKPALRVASTAAIEVVAGADPDWVGRGALKLDGLLDDLAAVEGSPQGAGHSGSDAPGEAVGASGPRGQDAARDGGT